MIISPGQIWIDAEKIWDNSPHTYVVKSSEDSGETWDLIAFQQNGETFLGGYLRESFSSEEINRMHYAGMLPGQLKTEDI